MSFNFAFFNGEVKRDRKHEAMMNSLNERENFIRQLNLISEQRTLDEKKGKASRVIQKQWKRYRAKWEVRNGFRNKFDEIVNETEKRNGEEVRKILQLLCNFYESKRDEERLILGLSEAVRISREHSDECKVILPEERIFLLAKCCIKFMNCSTAQTNFFMVFRFLETFISPDANLVRKCSKIGLFEAEFRLMEATCEPKPVKIEIRVPPPRCQQVLTRIFEIFEGTAEKKYNTEVITRFLKAICTDVSSLVFINYVAPFYEKFVNSKNPDIDALFDGAISLNVAELMKKYASRHPILRLRIISLIQSTSLENPGTKQLETCFNCLAKLIAVPKMENEMEFDDEISTFLSDKIEKELDSSKMRKLSMAYANLESVNFVNIISLRNQFLHILDFLAVSHKFMNSLFEYVYSSCNQGTRLIENLENVEEFKSALILFCECIKKRFSSIADSEFDPENVIRNFVIVLHFLRDTCLKLINLVHPDVGSRMNQSTLEEVMKKARNKWKSVCDSVVTTLQVVHEKDQRVNFLDELFWSDHDRNVVITKWGNETVRRHGRHGQHNPSNEDSTFVQRLADGYESGDSSGEEEEKKLLFTSPIAARNLFIMRNIPFIVPFMQRIKIFSKLLNHDRSESGINVIHNIFEQPNGYRITVRRDNLYSDAFEAMAPEIGKPDKDLRLPIRVKMVNWSGMNEAGVDGGGIFREFLNEVLKEGFDATTGLFEYTSDRLLYPNPASPVVYGTTYYRHYRFLGRMLGKLLYEKQLIELRFAEFFISLLFGSHRNEKDVDLQHMKSFDPLIFKQLRSLSDMSEKELDDLQLDFSLMTSEYGGIRNINLKPNGNNIRVNEENVNEYVRLYVNFYLKKRIEPMVNAMRKGISDVINIEWLSMFSSNEVQRLIAGTEEVFKISEMRKYCLCTNIRDKTDNDYIELFWDVVENLSADDKKALLKFITGCSRPPIEGFQQIYPALGILLVQNSNQLPTSAACMNMLNLPRYPTRAILEEKLRYAINSGAGFELM